MKKMEQRNCLPYFVNTPPPNIRKQKEYNSVAGQSDGSNAKPPAQTRYTVENNNRKPLERSEQQNYLNSRLKRDSRQQYEMASRAPNLSSNIDFSRPPPINQSPNQKYQSDCPRPPEVTKLPRMKSECSGKIQETLLNRTPEQNGIVRPPLSIVSQQSSGHQPSGSLRPPHPPNAHRFWPTQITDMFSVKRKPTVRTTPAARAQPPIPAGPPPSSPPPPPPGPPPAGPTLEVKRQLLTPPSMMPQLQTTSRGGDQQLSVMPRLPLEVKQQSQTPPFDVKQQIQTPPPRFVTPPSQPTYYAQAPPFFLAIGSYTDGGLFKVPPPMIRTRGGVPGTVFQGPPAKTTYYIQESTYVNPPNSGYNHYKRSRVSDSLDPELRRGSKKKKKSLALILPQRKGWSVEDAKKAIDIEKECSKGTRKYSLFIKFPDPELNREIVSSFHSAIESVHFQQPSTPRFCFVNISSSADPEAVRQELNKVQFGGGYLSAEFKKDREDDYNINPEDIDPTTLYVGNLAQEVTKDDMLRMYPTSKRIDIGYAKKMKFTRYAFVAFKNAVDAIEAYKKTHDTQMYNKSLIVRFRRMNGTIGMLGEPKVQSKTDKDRSQSKSSEMNGQMPSEENENETVDNNPWNIDVSTWEESFDDMYDDDCMLDVKPSLEDLEKDVKVPRDIDQFLLRDNLEDFFSPNILDEAKREITSEDATRRDTFSDSHNKTSIRLQEDHNDIHPSPNTSEVDNSELDNPVKVKDEIKSEVDQTRDDKSLRSTYRQLMLTRRKKNLAIKVEEDNNAIKTEAGRSETSNLEKERVDDLFGVNASKSDRETNQEHLKDSISIADDDRGPQENIEEIEKKVKEETPHSLTNRCISTYGELKEFGMKMQITRKVMVKEEIESVGCDLQDDQLHAVDVQEADTDLSLDTGITGQAQGGQNVQSSELSRNEDNLTNTMTSSQTNNAHGSTLEFDSCTEVNARQNQAAEQENGEFNFDVDLNSLLTDVKKEPRVEDYENYDELDEEEDDDIENFLKRRKAQI